MQTKPVQGPKTGGPSPAPPIPATYTQTCIDAGLAHARVGGVVHGFDKGVVSGVEVDRPGRVDNAAGHVRAKVNLADVVVLQHRLVAVVRRPMSSHVVEGAARGEGQAPFQALDVGWREGLGASGPGPGRASVRAAS